MQTTAKKTKNFRSIKVTLSVAFLLLNLAVLLIAISLETFQLPNPAKSHCHSAATYCSGCCQQSQNVYSGEI